MAKGQGTDAEILKALNHPVRRQVMALLDDGIASSKEIAATIGLSIPAVSYHVGILRDLGLIKVVRETPRRGAIERHYKSVGRSLSVRQVISWLLDADRTKPRGWNAKQLELDTEGAEAVRTALDRLWKDIDRAEHQAARRAGKAGSSRKRHAVAAFSTET